jgi:hypothetical protein
MLMLLAQIETIEHARFRAMAQITLDNEKGVEAFEEYMKLAFPYLDGVKKRDRNKFVEQLKQETSRGPIRVRAASPPKKGKSRLKEKMVAHDAKARKDLDALYGKLGDTLPIHEHPKTKK